MKTVLMLAHDDEGQEARLQTALDLARALGGHLTCLGVAVVSPMPGDVDGMVSGVLMAEARERAAATRARIEARLARADVPWDWIEASGTLAACVKDAARLADLIVVNRRIDSAPSTDMEAAVGELIVTAGKPLVAVPETARGFAVAGRALVAWDGSATAAAAVRAAVPLLSRAESVTVLTVARGTAPTDAGAAATYLSRHGIRAEILVQHDDGDGPAALLLREIRAGQVDYVVMGGFGHRRMTEALFGGVTRRMLARCPVPIVLAH
ncbi:universal stress protein [Sphingomonas sp. ac-8]|uniref:universal stress protein n=1 Tax=Sphingomonas sp. ac-8 TaxID=3242977 RepID=UPI003A8133DE